MHLVETFPEMEVAMTAAKEYERPQIVCYGKLGELTEGQSVGNLFDGNFHVTQGVPPAFLSCVPGSPHAIFTTCGSFVP